MKDFHEWYFYSTTRDRYLRVAKGRKFMSPHSFCFGWGSLEDCDLTVRYEFSLLEGYQYDVIQWDSRGVGHCEYYTIVSRSLTLYLGLTRPMDKIIMVPKTDTGVDFCKSEDWFTMNQNIWLEYGNHMRNVVV